VLLPVHIIHVSIALPYSSYRVIIYLFTPLRSDPLPPSIIYFFLIPQIAPIQQQLT
jgi:hypothetical protein